MFGKTPVHEVPISYSHTERHLLSSPGYIRSFAYQKLNKLNPPLPPPSYVTPQNEERVFRDEIEKHRIRLREFEEKRNLYRANSNNPNSNNNNNNSAPLPATNGSPAATNGGNNNTGEFSNYRRKWLIIYIIN